MKKTILLLILILLSSVISIQAGIASTEYLIVHDGAERITNLYVPEGDLNAALIVLHPVYSSGLAMEVMTGLNEVADERGWVIAYANSLTPYWDDGRGDEGIPPLLGTVDDPGFIDSLADSLSSDFGLDSVFLVGMGNGGTMAMVAACQMPERFDAVVVVSALMWDYQVTNCDTYDNPIAVNTLFIYGNMDFLFAEDGREVQSFYTNEVWHTLSAKETLGYWVERNRCDRDSASGIDYAIVNILSDCGNDTQTAFYVVPNGAGNWPRMAANKLNRMGTDASKILAAFLAGDENWLEHTTQETLPDTIARNYILYVPQSYDPSTPTPIVVSLHGRGASMVSQARSSGFNDVADQDGFIVLYPQAYDPTLQDPTWNYGYGNPVYTPGDWNDDEFLDILIDDLAQDLNIDMNRLYVTGLSNGGYMTNRLACTRSERYAAFAAVSGAAPFGLAQLCEETSHSPYMLVQGTADRISPWEGIVEAHPVTGQAIYMIAPVENTLNFWATHNECTGEVVRENLPNSDPDSSVSIITAQGCPDDAAVILYAVVGGGHNWPGVFDFDSALLGEVNMDYNASEIIWAFFSQYTLAGRVGE
jgi:polyhydroxybutyrate depolymerase